jgi:hypothetical protein
VSKDLQRKEARTRSFSNKRNLEVSPSSTRDNKVARLDNGNALLGTIHENLVMLEHVSNEILDATGSDPVLVSIVSRLCTGMSTQNNLLATVISNMQSQQNTVSDTQGTSSAGSSNNKPDSANSNNAGLVVNQNALQKRKPLKQVPIGSCEGEWVSVTNNKSKKADVQSGRNVLKQKVGGESSGTQGPHGKMPPTEPDLFINAVREAERSVVIYNLDLGQSPLLNPKTISAKVTGALLSTAAKTFTEGDSNLTGEMVNDLLCQVKSMNLFGKGTKPCRNPKDSSSNGKFYTIPVKLSFQNKQVAKQVKEILRKEYKVSTSIPYHKTLKKAMTLAHEKTSTLHPGKQVMITLDAAGKCLKSFTRDPPQKSGKGEKSGWESSGKLIPLPPEALDPKIREISDDFSLPTTHTLVNKDDQSPWQSTSGTTHCKLKIGEQAAAQLAAMAAATADPQPSLPPPGSTDSPPSDDNENVTVSSQPQGEEMDTVESSSMNGNNGSCSGHVPEY